MVDHTPSEAEGLAAAMAEAEANPMPTPPDILAARAARAAWKNLTEAERRARYEAAVEDIRTGRVKPEGLYD